MPAWAALLLASAPLEGAKPDLLRKWTLLTSLVLAVPLGWTLIDARGAGFMGLAVSALIAMAFGLRRWRTTRWRVGVAMVALLLRFAPVWGAVRAAQRYPTYARAATLASYDLHWLDKVFGAAWPLWQASDGPTPAVIALTAGYFPTGENAFRYPFAGSRLQNKLVYVSPLPDGTVPSYREESLWREQASFELWVERLRRQRVELVAVMPPLNLEASWMEAHPELFERVAEGENAPPRPGRDVAWLNVERPLLEADLRHRVVVLDFWTYCCINCLHTLPVLAALEERLRGEPGAFVGVHSAKYANEKDPAMVREALRRYGVHHPVVVDSDHRVWDDYAVSAWPTLVVVDSRGYILGQMAGEPSVEDLERELRRVLADMRREGRYVEAGPLPIRPDPSPEGPLLYPTMVRAHEGRVFIADTGHHQIVELSLRTDGRPREVRRFGDGLPGWVDGLAETARFRSPNGMALDPATDTLFVADTGNHAIRKIDLRSGSVICAAGTGERAKSYPHLPADGRRTALRSPWDLAWDPERKRLYVAMAGTHQLYALRAEDCHLELLAGTGREARVDGTARRATFAQPSGLALTPDGRLFVADSETSCIRELDLETAYVETLAGGDLFDFGDQDGAGNDVRLQHPMGVATDGRRVYVADSFNHKVKELDPANGRVQTLFGSKALRPELVPEEGIPVLPLEASSAQPLFFEPEGIALSEGFLFVADTNNHRVLSIELDTGTVALVAGRGREDEG